VSGWETTVVLDDVKPVTRAHKFWAQNGTGSVEKRGLEKQIALTHKHLQNWDSDCDHQVNNHLTSLSKGLDVNNLW